MKIFSNIIFGIAIIIFSSNVLYAQIPGQQEAKEVLKKTTQTLKSFKSAKIQFTLLFKFYRNKQLLTDKKKGVLMFQKDKYKIELEKKTIFSDGKSIWTYDKEVEEVLITEAEKNNYLSPSLFLTNFYDKDFLYKLNGEKQIQNINCYEIELTPFDKTKPFHKIYLYINKQTNLVQQLEILENTANRIVLIVNKIKEPKKGLSPKKIQFDAKNFPKAEIIDLR